MAYIDINNYDIVRIAKDLGLIIKEVTHASKEVPACCPFCPGGDKKFHLNLNRYINTFRCPKCGAEGGLLQLIASIKGCTRSEAKELLIQGDSIYTPTANEIRLKNELQKEYMESKLNTKPIAERNVVYNALLDMLTLSDRHRVDLTKRGLPKDIISRNKYKSIPQVTGIRKNICNNLRKKYELAGIAGFYTDKHGDWDFYALPGFLIPVRDIKGRIQSLQVRLDNVEKRKYRYFSSTGYENGTPTESYVHITGKPRNGVIRITEGPLKADIAHYFTGEAYAAVPGVNSAKFLLPVLKDLKITKAYDDFDMDKYTRKEVKEGVEKIREALKSEGIKVIEAQWDKRYKGVDDYLLACYKQG